MKTSELGVESLALCDSYEGNVSSIVLLQVAFQPGWLKGKGNSFTQQAFSSKVGPYMC